MEWQNNLKIRNWFYYCIGHISKINFRLKMRMKTDFLAPKTHNTFIRSPILIKTTSVPFEFTVTLWVYYLRVGTEGVYILSMLYRWAYTNIILNCINTERIFYKESKLKWLLLHFFCMVHARVLCCIQTKVMPFSLWKEMYV